jgi:hypothetical protein
LRRTIASKTLSLGIRRSRLHRFAVDADPARLAIFLMRERFFSARITLTISLPAIGHRHLDDLPVDAAPTEFPTVPERFFSGGVTLAALFLAFRRVDQHDVAVNATPAEIFTMPERFFARRITLTFALATFLGRCLDNLAVDAAPTGRWFTIFVILKRLFWGAVALTTTLPTFGLGRLVELSVDAAPARFTISECFFFGTVALTAPFPAFRFGSLHDLSVDTAPTGRRWRWRTLRTTGKRPPPARRWAGRTRRVMPRGTVPFVTTTTGFPPPSAPLLLPNPLTTRVTPSPAINRRRRQHESMLVAVESYAFADNVQAIVDRLGDSQHFEIARR